MALFYDDDYFPTLDLNAMQTLDFEVMLSDSGHRWSEGEPLVNEEDEGLTVFKVNPAAIDWILAQTDVEDEVWRADLELLRAFVAQNGADAMYEWATF